MKVDMPLNRETKTRMISSIEISESESFSMFISIEVSSCSFDSAVLSKKDPIGKFPGILVGQSIITCCVLNCVFWRQVMSVRKMQEFCWSLRYYWFQEKSSSYALKSQIWCHCSLKNTVYLVKYIDKKIKTVIFMQRKRNGNLLL